MADNANMQWTGRTDGLPWMHRSLIWMLKGIPISVFYGVMDVVIIFYMLFVRSAYLASYHYFRQRHHKSILSSFGNVYLTFRQFGQVVIDRFAVYAGRHFDFEIEGNEHVMQAMRDGNGCIMLSSHVGNYEMAGYFLRPTRRMCALMFGGEKGTILDNRKRIFESNGIQIITQDENWTYIHAINDALSNGDMLTLLADRNFGSPKTIEADILYARTHLPRGPFSIAQMYKEATTVSVFVMKDTASCYHIYVERLYAQSANEYAQQFATKLTQIVSRYPNQWYNFYDFWQS